METRWDSWEESWARLKNPSSNPNKEGSVVLCKEAMEALSSHILSKAVTEAILLRVDTAILHRAILSELHQYSVIRPKLDLVYFQSLLKETTKELLMLPSNIRDWLASLANNREDTEGNNRVDSVDNQVALLLCKVVIQIKLIKAVSWADLTSSCSLEDSKQD